MSETELLYKLLDMDTEILEGMLDAWQYFSEYDVPIAMKEKIEEALSMRELLRRF